MSLSWRRGFFRLWLVVAIGWVWVVGFFSYEEYNRVSIRAERLSMIPVICADARGKAGTDYGHDRDRGINPFDEFDTVEWHDACWYPVATYQRLYSPDPSTPIDQIRRTGYASAVSADAIVPVAPDVWWSMRQYGIIAVAPPLALLLFGAVIAWVVSGFRRPTST